jgi:hypothetical protein
MASPSFKLQVKDLLVFEYRTFRSRYHLCWPYTVDGDDIQLKAQAIHSSSATTSRVRLQDSTVQVAGMSMLRTVSDMYDEPQW